MGYSTDFKGELRLRAGTTVEELRRLRELFEFEHSASSSFSKSQYGDLSYIDLELTKDLGGVKWNGNEKTYYLQNAVKMIVGEMRKEFPSFTLNGTLQAQGEDAADRWDMVVEDGAVRVVKYRMVGEKVTCPHCEETFVPGGKFEPVS